MVTAYISSKTNFAGDKALCDPKCGFVLDQLDVSGVLTYPYFGGFR